MGCLILVIIFLFSIILSEYDIPEEDLPIIGIITIIVKSNLLFWERSCDY